MVPPFLGALLGIAVAICKGLDSARQTKPEHRSERKIDFSTAHTSDCTVSTGKPCNCAFGKLRRKGLLALR
jgi:hypothetical protein